MQLVGQMGKTLSGQIYAFLRADTSLAQKTKKKNGKIKLKIKAEKVKFEISEKTKTGSSKKLGYYVRGENLIFFKQENEKKSSFALKKLKIQKITIKNSTYPGGLNCPMTPILHLLHVDDGTGIGIIEVILSLSLKKPKSER